MKNLINVLRWRVWQYSFLLIFALSSCSDTDERVDSARFAIDCDNSAVEGSFVQNIETGPLNVFYLAYKGSSGNATIWAKEVNGLYIPETNISLDASGNIKLPIKGKPIEEGEFTIKIAITIENSEYYCSQIFEVYKDEDPAAPIHFTMDEKHTQINGLLESVEIPFLVDPSTSNVQVTKAVTGLSFSRVVDKKTGEGVITLTPGDEFIGGDLEITISFGARTPVVQLIRTTVFLSGNGEDVPYEVNSATLLKKINALLDKNFILTNDIELESETWNPIGTERTPFVGSLNGNGKKVLNLKVEGGDNIGLFAYTGTSSVIENLTLEGKVKGNNVVAGLVANNAGKVNNVNAAEVEVEGNDFLSSLVAKNTGTISSSMPIDVLEFTGFPSMISEIKSTINKTLTYTPTTAVATIVLEPENIVATVSGNVLTLTPDPGFLSSEMAITFTHNKLTSLSKYIQLFSEEQFDAGDGDNNPFVISKASQFNKMRDYPDKKFVLAANIDFQSLESKWVPIPSFSGTLDGAGFSIENIIITDITEKGGLFIANSGIIKNISLPNIEVETTKSFGVLVGENSGTISNVLITGKVNSSHTGDLLGGVAAEALRGEITNVYADLDIVASCGMVGTIVGRARANASTISNCTAKGTITTTASKTRIAGIVGRGETGVVIRNCLSAVVFDCATNTNGVGGIFGANNNNNMKIEECMFTGQIKNAFMIGGIAGVAANIQNCLVEGAGASLTTPTIKVGGGSINTSSGGGIVGAGKVTVQNNIVRNLAITGTSTPTLPLAGVSSTFQDNGYVANSVAYNLLIDGTSKQGIASNSANNSKNYVTNIVYQNPEYTPIDDANGLDGGMKQAVELNQAFYESIGFDFTLVWKWEEGEPQLRDVGYKGNLSITR